MENSEGILKFRSLNIVEYLNTRHPVYEASAISEAKHELSTLLNQVDRNMYNYFLEKSDCLLNLLNIYQKCYVALSNFKDSKVFYESSQDDIEMARSDDFKRKCRLFVEDMSIFMTNERYLVSAEFFNDGGIFCILANDMLFIGERVEKDKYSLRRSIHKGSVRMEMKDNTLNLLIEGGFCALTGSKCALENFYEAFLEVSYEYAPEAEEEASFDQDYINFCVETRRFGDISRYFGMSDKKRDFLSAVIDGLDVDDESELQALMNLHKAPSRFFKAFFVKRFKEGLSSINRIQRFSDFLGDVFDFLESFSKSFIQYCTEHDISRRTCVLCMEECTLEALSSLENRTFNGSTMRNEQDVVESIKDRLRLGNMDFRYLVGKLKEKKATYASRYLNQCKEEIRQKLDSFWNEQ